MTSEERVSLVNMRDEFGRYAVATTGFNSGSGVAALYAERAAALDAALRELDTAAALRAELPGLIREVRFPVGVSDGMAAWRRLCELLPGLEGDG